MFQYLSFIKQLNFFQNLETKKDCYISSIEGVEKKILLVPSNRKTFTIKEKLIVKKNFPHNKVIKFYIENKNGDVLGSLFISVTKNCEGLILPINIKKPSVNLTILTTLESWFTKIVGVEDIYVLTSSFSSKLLKPTNKKTININSSQKLFKLKTQKRKKDNLILTAGPSISNKEIFYANDAAANGWNNSWSKYLDKFEEKFADYIGSKYAIATSSCTGALQIALMALDIGPGDEVIVPDLTWVSTANAVKFVGATPIFADVEFNSWNLDPNSVQKLINNNTKAIMPVHMYGNPASMNKISSLAKKYKLYIIEDAAPAIGASFNGKTIGNFGDFSGFSFQGAKLLVTGEGGMLVTSNYDLYKKARKIWDQGRNPKKTFWIDGPGVKFKMSNIQAAIGLGQLERADELIAMKRRIFSWYYEELSQFKDIQLHQEIDGAKGIYWMSSIFLNSEAKLERNLLIKKLRENKIDSRPVFPAISQYPIWPKKQAPKITALNIGNRSINLPSGVCLKKDEVIFISKTLRNLLS